jgi:hypothetical protein
MSIAKAQNDTTTTIIVPWVTAPWTPEATDVVVGVVPAIALTIIFVIIALLTWRRHVRQSQAIGGAPVVL